MILQNAHQNRLWCVVTINGEYIKYPNPKVKLKVLYARAAEHFFVTAES